MTLNRINGLGCCTSWRCVEPIAEFVPAVVGAYGQDDHPYRCDPTGADLVIHFTRLQIFTPLCSEDQWLQAKATRSIIT